MSRTHMTVSARDLQQPEMRSSRSGSATPTTRTAPRRGGPLTLSARDGQPAAYQFGVSGEPVRTVAGYSSTLLREVSPGAATRSSHQPALRAASSSQLGSSSSFSELQRRTADPSTWKVVNPPPVGATQPAAAELVPVRSAPLAPRNVPAAIEEANADSPKELASGCQLRVQDCVCKITHALGMGSFGAVWAADAPNGAELAVKEIYCNMHSDLMNALFESHLLRVLGNRPPHSVSEEGREAPQSCIGFVPSLVASESVCVGVDTWRVRLVMTRVPGEPLDLFLENRRKCCESSAEGGGTGALGWCGLPPLAQQFDEACFFAHELIAQLAPVFERISEIALHRDVNSHNILIDSANVSLNTPPKYGLVDFGLAVDSACWCEDEGASTPITRPSRIGQDGSSTWHYLDVGGDCRYWPLAAWVQFLAGWRELDACQTLCAEYQLRLDLHALGITALQLLADLLPLPPEVLSGVRSAEQLEDALDIAKRTLGGNVWDDAPPELLVLRIVWERYWSRVSPLHGRLIRTFHTNGDWDRLKMDCIESGVHDKIAEDLRLLRAAINEAREACKRSQAQSQADGQAVPSAGSMGKVACSSGLFDALLILVSDGRSTDTMSGPEVWRMVLKVIAPSVLDDSCSPPQQTSSASRMPAHLIATTANLDAGGVHVALGDAEAELAAVAPLAQDGDCNPDQLPPERLSRRLNDLKSKVAWLSQEMAKLGEKSEAGRRPVREPENANETEELP